MTRSSFAAMTLLFALVLKGSITSGQSDTALSGALRVHLDPAEVAAAGAAWRVDGGPFHASDVEIPGLAPGFHQVDFFRPAGWSEPEAREVLVVGGASNGEAAEYQALPAFYFESVPPETARHGATLRLIVHSSDPTSPANGKPLVMRADPQPVGPIAYDSGSQELGYTPDAGDRTDFTVTFTASTPAGSIEGKFRVSPLPTVPPEDGTIVFQGDRIDPESQDYVRVREEESSVEEIFNTESKKTHGVSISGAWLVFEAGSTKMNLYDRFNGRKEIKELLIFADTVTIRSPLRLPQTRVEIHARELRFEGNGSIDTTPDSKPNAPEIVTENDGLNVGRNGENGVSSPGMVVAVERFHSDPTGAKRFILRGAKGQDAGEGRNGRPILDSDTKICDTFNGHPVVYTVCVNLETDEESGVCGSENVHSEDAVRAGRPGEGGSGGTLLSTLDLSAFADVSGGVPGKKGLDRQGGAPAPGIFGKYGGKEPPHGCQFTFKLIVPARGGDRAAPAPQRAVGPSGGVELTGDPGLWLHPILVQSYLFYLKDIYIAASYAEARKAFFDYATCIRLLKSDLPDGEEKSLFDQFESKLRSLVGQIDGQLDYFGNPITWVPMLSFEANLTAFTTELDRAIPVLYLSYWIESAANRAKNTQNAILAAKQKLDDEIDEALDAYEEAQDAVPLLEIEADEMQLKMDRLTVRLRTLESELEQRAQENVDERHKVPFWRKAIGVLGAITRVIPFGQPALGYVGAGLSLVSKFDPDHPLAQIDQVPTLIKSVKGTDYVGCLKGKAAETKKDVKKERPKRIDRVTACASLLAAGVKNIMDVLKTTAASADEVKAELDKLRAEDATFNQLTRDLAELNIEKQLLGERLVSTIQIITSFSTLITEKLLAIDKLNQNLSSVLAVLDHQALLHVAEMGFETRDRLLKYQYLMAKAYQYRILKPYTGSLKLDQLFDQIKELVDFDNAEEDLSAQDFESLKAIYLAELGRIADGILTDLNANAPQRSAPVSFRLSPAEVSELNETGKLVIDLARRNLFGAREENLRIVDLKTNELKVRTTGQLGGTATMRLNFEHSGFSRIQSDGHSYLFTHYRTERVNPIRWSTVYDGLTGRRNETTISAAADSLLRVLLGLTSAASDSVLLYSRPAALAQIIVTKEVTADNGVSIDVDDLVLQLEYDYSEKSQFIHDLHVEVNDELLPLVTISRNDLDGRDDGLGNFRRSYQGAAPVRIEAPETYGAWTFERWESANASGGDGGGAAVLGTSPVLELTVGVDTFVRAVYTTASQPTGGTFRRGDSNLDGNVNISDPTVTLAFLFTGGRPLGCEDSGDANDDGKLDISDAITTLNFLFTGTATIPPPGAAACGADPTTDNLQCDSGGTCG